MQAQSQQTINLKDYRWKHRLILLFAASKQTSNYKEQLKLIESQTGGLQERDLLVFSFFADNSGELNNTPLLKKDVEEIREKYSVKASEQLLILIGKDGGEKLRNSLPTKMNEIYGLIDRMPMRRQEMRESKH